MKFETKLLSNLDIEESISLEEVVGAVERTWSEYALGRVVNPSKLGLDLGESGVWPGYNGFMNAMPAYVGWLDTAGLKWAGGFWNNVSLNLPSIRGMIILIDPRTGEFRAVLDGSLITALRTAAQTVVGIKYLATKEFKSIGIFGAGTQAQHHTRMFSQFFPSKEIRIYDIRKEALQKTVREIVDKVNLKIVACDQPQGCSRADVIVTLTTAKRPFLRAEWVREGHLIEALGSYQEVDPDAIRKADKVVVDHPEQTLHRGALRMLAEKGEMTEKDIYATIGQIIAGLKLGRENDREIIFFEPVGTGMLDVAVATVAYRKAVEKGLGKEFEFVKVNSS